MCAPRLTGSEIACLRLSRRWSPRSSLRGGLIMKRVLGTVIVGCAVTAIAVALSTASANAESFRFSEVMSAKDGGALIALGAKDAGSMMLAKDGGSAALE